jgi:glucuronate isomerase
MSTVADALFEQVATLPIVSPHGHVDAALLADDAPWPDAATLLVKPDHYVTRLLHADGVPLDDLLHGEPRAVWRLLCEHWAALRGTTVQLWLELVLRDVLDVAAPPTDETFDQIAQRLAQPEFRPRALYRRFGIEALATTDDPTDDLRHHQALAGDDSWDGRVIPTFRPDAYLDPATADLDRLAAAAGISVDTYDDYIAAMELRRETFRAHGATASDHGVTHLDTRRLADGEARRIFSAARRGQATAEQRGAFCAHMLDELARMACEDGLVMQLHPWVLRDHHSPTAQMFGPNVGADIPLRAEYTRALRPLLERYGTHPRFRLVVYTIDETTYSRELAPLAGFYPSVYLGAPWWFLDSPAGMMRFRQAVTETVGFARTAGFVDDARSFCSIPARHRVARRVDCAFLAQLVAEGRLSLDEAADTARDLAYDLPRRVFRLE